METEWVKTLDDAMNDVAAIKMVLGLLSEQELEVLAGFKPIIDVLASSCDFLIANMNVIIKRLEQQ